MYVSYGRRSGGRADFSIQAVRGSQETPLESRVKEVNGGDSNLSYMLNDEYTYDNHVPIGVRR